VISLIPLVAALLKFCIGLRIVAFTSTHHKTKPFYSFLAVVFVAYFLGSAVLILVFGHLVTLAELFLTLSFAVLIFSAKGNVAELFRGFGRSVSGKVIHED